MYAMSAYVTTFPKVCPYKWTTHGRALLLSLLDPCHSTLKAQSSSVVKKLQVGISYQKSRQRHIHKAAHWSNVVQMHRESQKSTYQDKLFSPNHTSLVGMPFPSELPPAAWRQYHLLLHKENGKETQGCNTHTISCSKPNHCPLDLA